MPETRIETDMTSSESPASRVGTEPALAELKPTGAGEPRSIQRKATTVEVRDMNLYYGDFHAVEDVNMTIEPNRVTALIGSSGCGKTTFLRSINRMHELTPGARVEGEVVLDGHNIYNPAIDPVQVRRLVGMVFQAPNPFPTMSIYENVAAGLALNQKRDEEGRDGRDGREGRCAARTSGTRSRTASTSRASGLSGGQQQRLCIARATAVEPEVVLMDEPCSALDPIATLAIEDLIAELKQQVHDRDRHAQHAAGGAGAATSPRSSTSRRAGSRGGWSRSGPTEKIFTNPEKSATEDYVSGRFG